MKLNKTENKGNITILVLVIAVVVILGTASMLGYVFRDIQFTEVDEGKLRAFNFAEAGIADFQYNLAQYLNGKIEELPESGYSNQITSDERVEGSYTVTYEEITDEDSLNGYDVTSIGTDSNDNQRKIKVTFNINLSSSSSFDIYDYIYCNNSITFSGDGKPIEGPFYTEGDMAFQGSSGMLQQYSTGPVVVEGNLSLTGNTTSISSDTLEVGGNVVVANSSRIKKALLSIGGNLSVTGDAEVDYELQSPMIVMGDVYIDGSSRIGESGRDLVLSIQGDLTESGAPRIYADRNDSLTYYFSDPGYNVNDLINQFESNINGTALHIDEDVLLEEDVPFSRTSGGNILNFYKDDGKSIIEISGNVFINGDLTLGVERWWPKHTDIYYYTGEGTIYTTGSIVSHTKIVPLNESEFPEDSLLCLVSNTNINLDIWRDYWETPTCDQPNMFMVAIAKNDIVVQKGSLKGTAISGGLLDVDKDFGKICYLQDLKDHLPVDLPTASGQTEGAASFVIEKWQEIN